jgi:AcrR family transcriptional regulator
MKTTLKLSSDERRAAIIRAVRHVFAEKGFDGATTRELADAAGVSEALLFKHFPHKEAIFSAMQLSCCNEQDVGRFERLKALEPSAATLVLLVHFLISRIVGGCSAPEDDVAIQNRLMLRSLAEDGEFARMLLRKAAMEWVPKIEECVRAAVKAGEAVGGHIRPDLSAWFTHHLAAMIVLHQRPRRPVVDYDASGAQLVEQAVWFTLRGIGLKEEVIKRNYTPKIIARFDD